MSSKLFFCLLVIVAAAITSCQAQIALQKSRAEKINAVAAMSVSRATHTATLLDNGKVLLAGGFSQDRKSLSSAEIFDSGTKTFSAGGNMSVARASHSATLLPDGKVLIAGGFNGDYLDSAEIYDAKTGKFTPTGKMTMPRSGHVAVLLGNGKVLLAGGVGTGWTFLADAELYDPATKSFTRTGSMNTARESHTVNLLRDGTALITGGHQGRRAAIMIYRSAEIYDPQKGVFTAVGDLTVRRHKHDAVSLADGRVLVVGGADERDGEAAYQSVEIYDPRSKTFSQAGEMKLARYKLQGTTVLLRNGKVLIAGGANQAELFDPETGKFEIVPENFETTLLFATATLLPDGRLLVAGGYDRGTSVRAAAWIYRS